MKPYLVDVPVALYVFIRPDTLARVFDVIKKARPSTLFLISDGPRANVPTDKEKIKASRKIVEDVDWDCKVHKFYFDKNQGMYPMSQKSKEYIFSRVDRCIFLEDDVVTSVGFFKYCSELLEKYKDDLRISMICGMNHMGVYEDTNTDYFFSKASSIWGFAIWRRTFELFNDFSYGEDGYILARLKENSRKYKRFSKSLEGYCNNKNYNGHPAGTEFFLALGMYSQNQLNIIPKKNMVCNIGCGKGSTHFSDDVRKVPRAIQNMFSMATYEYDFPLKHPTYVVEDINYEKILFNIMGRSLHIKTFRFLERILREWCYSTNKQRIDKLKRIPQTIKKMLSD
jgi:hypothetical protein